MNERETYPKSRILLADDAAFMRMMQKDILEKNGYEVCGDAVNGREAVEKYRILQPDIVILNITMPDMDGLEALRRIKTDYPHAKAIMCTAMCFEGYVVTALKYGARDFIAKPFTAESLAGAVRSLTDEKSGDTAALPESIVSDWCAGQKNYKPNEALSQEQINEILDSYNYFYKLASSGNYSSKDKLTGCLKRGEFDADLKKMLEDAESSVEDVSVTLVLLDIDHFMRVNDTFGHETGDEVLKEIANVLLEIPAGHKTYRYSGDCFSLIFNNTEKEQVFLIMEEARKAIVASPECSRTSTTISAGIATYSEDGTGEIDLIRKADGAMFRAKSSGRNKIALAKEEKLVTKTAHYTVEQLKRLEKLSKERSISEASLMREALDELLKKYDK